ncbi:hypothetical protein SARC_01881 [Sphaeroforma arctica JP610]|uniref:Bromo domain-containing protein n=1 Tax=Sphaeroforma arctica JP610 TaxID=667725 RepID=A0A0L0GAK2_9EUKA|nr:hypothetical protein SARC_01881 [Sphaeroforma arctica JP610]KNC85934.1 hypothetical protein SARC_01881 [Sphaeroforma arctica JP610]|eukprot:XP_014159836.1 hypothetical protein SARC_01881 [Sphaeroforma arctica JP610]
MAPDNSTAVSRPRAGSHGSISLPKSKTHEPHAKEEGTAQQTRGLSIGSEIRVSYAEDQNSYADASGWSLREQLTLTQAAYRCGVDDMATVSRLMRKLRTSDRPSHFFSVNSCTSQMKHLEKIAAIVPAKASTHVASAASAVNGSKETGGLERSLSVGGTESSAMVLELSKRLYHARIAEIKLTLAADREEYKALANDIDKIREGVHDQELDTMIQGMHADGVYLPQQPIASTTLKLSTNGVHRTCVLDPALSQPSIENPLAEVHSSRRNVSESCDTFGHGQGKGKGKGKGAMLKAHAAHGNHTTPVEPSITVKLDHQYTKLQKPSTPAATTEPFEEDPDTPKAVSTFSGRKASKESVGTAKHRHHRANSRGPKAKTPPAPPITALSRTTRSKGEAASVTDIMREMEVTSAARLPTSFGRLLINKTSPGLAGETTSVSVPAAHVPENSTDKSEDTSVAVSGLDSVTIIPAQPSTERLNKTIVDAKEAEESVGIVKNKSVELEKVDTPASIPANESTTEPGAARTPQQSTRTKAHDAQIEIPGSDNHSMGRIGDLEHRKDELSYNAIVASKPSGEKVHGRIPDKSSNIGNLQEDVWDADDRRVLDEDEIVGTLSESSPTRPSDTTAATVTDENAGQRDVSDREPLKPGLQIGETNAKDAEKDVPDALEPMALDTNLKSCPGVNVERSFAAIEALSVASEDMGSQLYTDKGLDRAMNVDDSTISESASKVTSSAENVRQGESARKTGAMSDNDTVRSETHRNGFRKERMRRTSGTVSDGETERDRRIREGDSGKMEDHGRESDPIVRSEIVRRSDLGTRRGGSELRDDSSRKTDFGRRDSSAYRRSESGRKSLSLKRHEKERRTDSRHRVDLGRRSDADRRSELDRCTSSRTDLGRRSDSQTDRRIEPRRRSETERTRDTERIRDAERTRESDRARDTDRTRESDRTREAERMRAGDRDRTRDGDRKRDTDRIRETDRSREVERTDRTRDADKPDRDADRNRASSRSRDAERSRDNDKGRELEKMRDANRTRDTERTRATDKTRETDRIRESDRTRETERAREADKVREAAKSREAERARDGVRSREAERAREVQRSGDKDRLRDSDHGREGDRGQGRNRDSESERNRGGDRTRDGDRSRDRSRETDRSRDATRASEGDRTRENDRSRLIDRPREGDRRKCESARKSEFERAREVDRSRDDTKKAEAEQTRDSARSRDGYNRKAYDGDRSREADRTRAGDRRRESARSIVGDAKRDTERSRESSRRVDSDKPHESEKITDASKMSEAGNDSEDTRTKESLNETVTKRLEGSSDRGSNDGRKDSPEATRSVTGDFETPGEKPGRKLANEPTGVDSEPVDNKKTGHKVSDSSDSDDSNASEKYDPQALITAKGVVTNAKNDDMATLKSKISVEASARSSSSKSPETVDATDEKDQGKIGISLEAETGGQHIRVEGDNDTEISETAAGAENKVGIAMGDDGDSKIISGGYKKMSKDSKTLDSMSIDSNLAVKTTPALEDAIGPSASDDKAVTDVENKPESDLEKSESDKETPQKKKKKTKSRKVKSETTKEVSDSVEEEVESKEEVVGNGKNQGNDRKNAAEQDNKAGKRKQSDVRDESSSPISSSLAEEKTDEPVAGSVIGLKNLPEATDHKIENDDPKLANENKPAVDLKERTRSGSTKLLTGSAVDSPLAMTASGKRSASRQLEPNPERNTSARSTKDSSYVDREPESRESSEGLPLGRTSGRSTAHGSEDEINKDTKKGKRPGRGKRKLVDEDKGESDASEEDAKPAATATAPVTRGRGRGRGRPRGSTRALAPAARTIARTAPAVETDPDSDSMTSTRGRGGTVKRGEKRAKTNLGSKKAKASSPKHIGKSTTSAKHQRSNPQSPAVKAEPQSGDEDESDSGIAAKRQKTRRRLLMGVLRDIMNHKYANTFLKPVNPREAFNYTKIVKRPMDLNTIKKRLDDGTISTTVEFRRDLMLVFTNAMMYNESGHDVYIMAHDMKVDVTEQLQMFMTTAHLAEDGRQSTLKDKSEEEDSDEDRPILTSRRSTRPGNL